MRNFYLLLLHVSLFTKSNPPHTLRSGGFLFFIRELRPTLLFIRLKRFCAVDIRVGLEWTFKSLQIDTFLYVNSDIVAVKYRLRGVFRASAK